jgi:hypothetical protein
VVEALLAAGVSTLLYNLGIGLPAFLIPLQMVLIRRGGRAFLMAAATALAAIAGVRLALGAGQLGGAAGPLAALELSMVMGLIAGLAWVQLPELLGRRSLLPGGRTVRLLVAAAGFGVASVPLLVYLGRNEAFAANLRSVFDAAAGVLNRFLAPEGPGLKGEDLAAMTRAVFLRSYLLDYLVLLTFSWWVGTVWGRRSLGRPSEITPLARFRPPEGLIWPLIGGLALVLLSLVATLGPLELAGWNLLLCMMFVYGLAGLGILRFLLERFGVPRGMRVAAVAVLVILAFAPAVNAVLAVLIPALGVSETWINYRRIERKGVNR